MKNRIYNFGAGPGMLPEPVLREAQSELLNWQGMGISILELGHRTPEFVALLQDTENDLRDLMNIPDNYQVLFLGTAARMQFSMIPLNFLNKNDKAGYIVSGIWSYLAYEEALRIKNAYCVAEDRSLNKVPDESLWNILPQTQYIYYTPNETINGVSFKDTPKVADIPLVADMTSCILASPIDITKFGLIFAGTQKNIAGAGLTIVIVRDDLLTKTQDTPLPAMLDYKVHSENNSLYATPPVFNCYLAGKTFKWIKAQGGVQKLYEDNLEKANLLYDFIDSSEYYENTVTLENRSIFNICFYLKNKSLEEQFVKEAKSCGLYALKGHRKVGGLRASLYNAMPIAGVKSLINFMQDFAKKHQL